MKNIAKVAGIIAVASVSAAATVIILNDEAARAKLRDSMATIKNTAREMGSIIADGVSKMQVTRATSTEKNQAWVDEQWEALGI